MRRSRDKRAESSLSEQPVGGQGGGGLRDIELPTTLCVPPTRGSKNWDQYLLVSLVAPRSLKRAMVKDCSASLSLNPPSSSRRASLFLVTLLPNWEREQEEFREASEEQETHPHKASDSGAAFKDSPGPPTLWKNLQKKMGGRLREGVRNPILSLDHRACPYPYLRNTEISNSPSFIGPISRSKQRVKPSCPPSPSLWLHPRPAGERHCKAYEY